MNRTIQTLRILLVIVSIYFPVAEGFYLPEDFTSFWAGIEVIGVDRETAQGIRRVIPIKTGEIFYISQKKNYYQQCEDAVKANYNVEKVKCSSLVLTKGTTYLIVQIIPAGGQEPVFRTLSTNTQSAKLPKELLALYDKLDERKSAIIERKGYFPFEKQDKDYLDYEDPILHKYAFQLSKVASKHNKLLLEVIRSSDDVEERRTAATLLSWAKHPDNLEYIYQWDLLNDPDGEVRNNLTRSYIFVMDKVKDTKLLAKYISPLCKQVALPYFADQNKSLFSIYEILNAQPELSAYIDKECKSNIENISKTSILINVGDVAKDILEIMKNSKDG